MAENDINFSLGRKIFFLHPSAFTQNQIIEELAQEEYEVYVFRDEAKLRQCLYKYPDSILFASINEVMKESAWEELLIKILDKPETSGVDIGIIATGSDEAIKLKYQNNFNPRCGYTVIKSDYAEAIKQLNHLLNGVNAKGRRKYIRLAMEKESNTTINIPIGGAFVNGLIKDISVVGFSCSFPEDPELAKNKLLTDIQIRLQAQLIKAEGIVFGSRMGGGEKIYVFLFTQRVDPNVRTRIRKYIHTTLQSRMDHEFK